LTQQAGETRNGVNAVKSTIDGMRTSRDQLLSEITTLKAQLKEQNHRLITLNKEKASFEAKKHHVSNQKSEEQIKIDVMNQEAALTQLREDVQEIKAEVIEEKF
jgi:predicted nuclease with TOPRIM domain